MTDHDVKEAQRDFESALMRSEKHVMGVGFLKNSTLRHFKSEIERLNLLETKVRWVLPVLHRIESGDFGELSLEEIVKSVRIVLDSYSKDPMKAEQHDE